MKPHPDIYRLMMERFSLKPEECFFVDDLPANIEGAIHCGLCGAVFYNDVGYLRRNLRDAGVNVAES